MARTLPALTLLPVLTLLLASCRSGAKLPGHVLEPYPAADFPLTDSAGEQISLARYRGRPIALTFLYTDCPDVCPVIGQRIGQALGSLGADAQRVAVLIVSVDPGGDTPEKAAAFLHRHGLAGPGRHYLLGDTTALEPVWLAYGVGSAPLGVAQRAPGEPQQFGRIGHTDAVYLVDRQGRNRTILRGDATAEEIAHGLRLLLR